MKNFEFCELITGMSGNGMSGNGMSGNGMSGNGMSGNGIVPEELLNIEETFKILNAEYVKK